MQKGKSQPELPSTKGFAYMQLEHFGLKELLLRISKLQEFYPEIEFERLVSETLQVIALLVILQLYSFEVVGTDFFARSMNPNRNRRGILRANNHPTCHEFLPHPCLDR